MAAVITDLRAPGATRASTSTPTPTPAPRDDLPKLSATDEMALVQHVRELFLRARDMRRPMVEQWKRNYKTLYKHQWSASRVDWLPRPEVPEVFPILDAIVSWMTDQEPTFDVAPSVSPMSPWYAEMDQLALDLKTTVRATWQVDKFSPEIEKIVWDAFTYNIGYLKTTWDGSAFRGFGNAVMRRVDPFAMYPDPDATSMESMNFLIEARTISRQEMERRFPGSIARTADGAWAESIDAQPTAIDQYGNGQTARANPAAISPVTSPNYGLPGQSDRVGVSDDPGVTLFEAWLRTPFHHDDGRVYDSWRCVVIAGNRVLMDEMAENLASHGQHPYDRYVCIETGEWYGVALVELLAPMQNSINRNLAAIEHNIWLHGNPILKEDIRAGLSRTQVTNKPGQRLTVNAGGQVDWLSPPQIHPQMSTDLIRFYISEMERVSGLSAVVRGASPTGRNAAGVIDAVQEAAFVRIRKSLRNLSFTIASSGEKLASMIVEFYDAPRIVALVGPSGEKSSLTLRSQHFYLPSEEGRVPMRFQLLIDAGEATSQSRGSRIAEADALYAMGAIDEEALLEIHSFPGWQKVVQRVREMKAQQGSLGAPPTQRAAARR